VTTVDERPHYRTAEQELSDSLEGTAPALSRTVAGLIGPARTAELAKAIERAVSIAVRRYSEDETAARLAALWVIVEQGVEGIPPECESAEPWSPDPDEAEQQARVDRFMAGGNGA
jgi:pyruvate/oxaloacetate carboxyltransferase